MGIIMIDYFDDPAPIQWGKPLLVYTTEEMAAMFRVSPKTVSGWCCDPENALMLGAFKPGGEKGSWRFLAETVDAYVARMGSTGVSGQAEA